MLFYMKIENPLIKLKQSERKNSIKLKKKWIDATDL